MSVLLRRLVFLTAALGYLAHGGQAHLAFSESETVSVLICGHGGHQIVEMSFGDTAPPEDTKAQCCDDCTHASDAASSSPPKLGSVMQAPICVSLSRQGDPVHPGGPLWPGAPSNGPPQTT
ncbi:MAG: hypothetical protein AAFY34_06890 [Pseudomonadota bacterium]